MPDLLIVAEYGTLNGGERSLLASLGLFAGAGWRGQALVPGHNRFAAALRGLGLGVTDWPLQDDQGQRRPLPELRQQLGEVIQRIQPDLVLANSLSTGRILGRLKPEFPGLPLLACLRDIMRLNRSWIGDLNRLDCRIAVSRATREFHVAQGIHGRHTEVVYNGVDLERFHPPPPDQATVPGIRRELSIPTDCRLVLFVGQIGLRKGLDVWLKAAARIAAERDDVHFLITGLRYSGKQESIEHERALRRQSCRANLAGRVHWLGERQDVPELMRQVSVLLHTPRQEPLGRVLLEACSSGLPVVATRVGGTSEILASGQLRSLLVESGDDRAAAAVVGRLLRDGQYARAISGYLRELAVQRFSSRIASGNLLALCNRWHPSPRATET